MRDRQEAQEFAVAGWEVDLQERLIKLQEKKYPNFRVYSFGRSYVYRFFLN